MRGPVFYWNLWKITHYSYVTWVCALVWNYYRLMGWPLPDEQWAYLVILGARGRKLIDASDQ